MKKLLCLLALCVHFAAYSQDESKENLDAYADKTNPYRKLAQSLDGIGQSDGVRNFTTFRGLDVNFCNTRFSVYLQTNFALSYKSSVDTKTTTLIKYVPRVSSGSQYINVKYTFQNRKDILGYMKTEDGTYNIVTGVEITGSKALIVNLFLMYWKPLQTTIGGYKIGEVASKQFYSDKVSLIGITASTAKITIQQGNTTMDYNATYGINAPKK